MELMDGEIEMVRKNFINTITIIVMISLFGCKSYSPTAESIVGTWVAKDGAILQLNEDGTFETKNLSGNVIFEYDEEYKGLFFNETGTWRLGKDQGEWVVFLRFNISARLTGGFATQISVGGRKGFFENKPPWFLFLWIGEEGENRYEFTKKETTALKD